MGLEINAIVEGDEERLGRDSLAGYDGRLYSFLVIENPTTLSIKVDPVHDDAMNYVMGIIANVSRLSCLKLTALTIFNGFVCRYLLASTTWMRQ